MDVGLCMRTEYFANIIRSFTKLDVFEVMALRASGGQSEESLQQIPFAMR